MKIDLTNEEYKKLLDLLWTSDIVINSVDPDEFKEHSDYNALMQKIYAYAKESELNDLLVTDENGLLMPSEKMNAESPVFQLLNLFVSDNFWEYLIDGLAIRDLMAKYKFTNEEDVFKTKNIENELDDLKDKYSEEFAENDLKNLVIK